MKVLITYFYNIRFLKPNQIPVSTAVWDPKWYHDFKDKDYIFKDKNGVYNGIRYIPFVPNDSCNGLCRGPETCDKTPDVCPFLQNYYKQIYSLDIDEVMNDFSEIRYWLGLDVADDYEIVLLVYEKPDNPCSERHTLIQWFKDNGIDIEEFKAQHN